jgi:hypothetical protein
MAPEDNVALTPIQEAVASVTTESQQPAKEEDAPPLPDGAQQQPNADNAGSDETPAEQSKPKPKPEAKVPAWMQKRLDEKTFREREAERRAVEAEKRAVAAEALAAETLRKAAAPGESGEKEAPPRKEPPSSDYVPKTEVEARASQLSADRAFSEETHKVLNAGIAEFPDFKESLVPLQAMGATDRRDFLDAAFATGEAHKVLHHLGNHPEEASALMGLSPVRMAAEMSKIAAASVTASKSKVVPLSNAPRPAAPVAGTARSAFDPYDKGVSMDAFSDWFDKELGPKILRRQ